MPTIDVTLPALHPGQRQVAAHEARFRILACGRRWGKTRLGAALCIEAALRGGRAWWVAPTYKVARVGWRLVTKLAQQIQGAEVRRGDQIVNFPTGGQVAVRSSDNPDSLRGEGLDFVVMDECAFMKEAAWTDALRPALSDRQGKAMFISTPAGRNWFWRLYQRGRDPEQDEWQAWSFMTVDNPYIAPREVEAARDSLPELIFRQEYLAEFLEGEGQVFRNIKANLWAPPDTKPGSHYHHRVIAGVDWARQQDFTAISVGCLDCGHEIAHDRFNKIEYAFQRDRLRATCERWAVNTVMVETNSAGIPNLEMLQRDGLPVVGFDTTPTTKPQMIQGLALVLEKEEFGWIDDPVWTGELEAYEQTISAKTGRASYAAPEGLHDDTVIARALVAWQFTRRPPPLPDTEDMEQPSRWRVGGMSRQQGSTWRKF